MINYRFKIACYIMMAISPVTCLAANVQVNTTETTTRNLGAGDTITVTDTGNLSGNDWGIYGLNVAVGSITNYGSISVSSVTSPGSYTQGHGIYLYNSSSTGISNYGTISGLHSALATWTSTVSGTIHNYGTLTGAQYGLYVDWQSNINGQIINHENGVITGLVNGVDLYQAYANGGLINNGLIKGGYNGVYLYVGSTMNGGLQNSGTIQGNTGITLENAASITGGIINSGTIIGTGGTALSLGTLGATTPITLNGGRIIGDVIHSTPSNGRSPVTVNGDFTTEGNFNVSNLTVTSGHTFTIAANNSVTLYDMAASTGGLSFSLSNNAHSMLTVTNGDVDIRNMTISVKASDNFFNHQNDYLIADGSTKVNGGNGQVTTVVADNSLLWNFRIADGSQSSVTTGGADNTQLYILPTQVSTINAYATSANNQAVATVLDNAWATSDPQLAILLNKISVASTGSEINQTLEAALPVVNNSAMNTSVNVSNNAFNMISSQLAQLQDQEPQSLETSSNDMTSFAFYMPDNPQQSNTLPSGNRMWGQAFRETANQGVRQGLAGYNADTNGFIVGLDTKNLHDKLIAGIAFGTAQTSVNGDDINQSNTNISSHQLTFYGNYNLAPQTYINGMGGIQYGHNKTQRYNVAGISGMNTEGVFGSQAYIARSEIGHHFKKDALTMTPSLMAQYTHFTASNYNEAGAGGIGLTNIGSNDMDKMELGTGLKVAYDIEQKNGGVLTPSLHADYRYDFIGDRLNTTSSFTGGGSSFTTNGTDPAQSTINTGIGFDYAYHNMHYTARYDYEHKDNYNAHSGYIRASYKF